MSETLDARLLAILLEHEADIALERNKHRANIPENETCGASTRAGTPCKRRDIYQSGRCALHGGLSTGPRTPEGNAKVTRSLPRQRPKPMSTTEY